MRYSRWCCNPTFERALGLNPASRMHREQLERGLAEVEEDWEVAAGRARRREAESQRQEADAERAKAKARARAERRERLLAEIRAIEGFEEARALGILYAGGYRGGGESGRTHAVGVDLELAEAAFRRAFKVDPRKRAEPGGRRDPKIYEVPTRLAGVYRARRELGRAAEVYEWVLARQDSPYAKVGLAAVRQDQGRPQEALALYEGVLGGNPDDSYALRGMMARTLASLDRGDEAVKAYERAAEVSGDAAEAARARLELRRLLGELRRSGKTGQAREATEALSRMEER